MPLKEVKYLDNYRIELIFENGKKKIHDFKHFLYNSNHPIIIKYRQLNLFRRPLIHNAKFLLRTPVRFRLRSRGVGRLQ